jgi:geranylgeranyl diphosphate synthase, type II
MEKYRDMINNYIDHIFLPSIPDQELREMTKYSLTGGKRLRSSIVLDITKNSKAGPLLDVALAVELLHTASLIIDDLPTMDNDTFRRGIYTTHKIYGVDKAKMVSFFFVSESNRIILSRDDCNKKIILKNLELLRRACLGQFYDMEWANNPINSFKDYYGDDLSPIVNLKTAPFFTIAFISGFCFSKKDLDLDNYVDKLTTLSESFSLAFQILDDFDDIDKDRINKSLNHVLVYGVNSSTKIFNKCMVDFKENLKILKMESGFFSNLIIYMENRLK